MGIIFRAALYARYSSENQRKESIEDQLATCRLEAATRGLAVLEPHVYADHAQSGASQDRPGLLALLAAAKQHLFDVVLVDDLSRLARDNLYMLITLSELSFHNVRVISVADGLDSADKGCKLAIQFRGIINELALSDLSDRTHRGQRGQKERGFDVGERTYGYQTVPVGEIRIDKRGRPRPDGYKKRIDPAQAAIIVRIFEEFVASVSIAGIARGLTEDGVPTARPQALGWSLSTVSRILHCEKYIGRWTWNRTGSRRDPRTGRRHIFVKPVSEHVVTVNEALRIVSPALWDAARQRGREVAGSWPQGAGRGYSRAQGPRSDVYPTHLLDGMLYCGHCNNRVGLVSGKRGGYYGCHSARRRLCDNRLTVCRSLVERVFPRCSSRPTSGARCGPLRP